MALHLFIKVYSRWDSFELDLVHKKEEEIPSKITRSCSYCFTSWLKWEMDIGKMHARTNSWIKVIANKTVIYF